MSKDMILLLGLMFSIETALPQGAYATRWCSSPSYPRITLHTSTDLVKTATEDTVAGKKKWGLGIGISGGLCWSGAHLKETSEPLDMIGAFFDWWYWLNSLEAYCSYVLHERWTIEAGMNYGWTNLSGRNGLESVRIPNARDSVRGSLATAPDWDLQKISLFIAGVKNGTLSTGIEITHAFASTKEAIWAPWIIEEAAVTRRCFGGGAFVLLKFNYRRDRKFNIQPYVGGRLSFAYEYDNNSPWEDLWEDRLLISFSGLYVGLQVTFGEVF